MTDASQKKAPYDRSDDFNGKQLGRIWQWNHNPDDKMWSLKNGRLRLQAQPAEQLMWARNTLTQRVIGPKSIATVELYVGGMKEGDVAGLGNINVPCSWIGIEQGHYGLLLRCFEQATNDTVTLGIASCDAPIKRVWLRMVGDFDNDKAHYEFSLNGEYYRPLGREMPLSYQLITFQGSRHALFCFNREGKQGGYAEFDNFTVEEPKADRSKNIPYGKTLDLPHHQPGYGTTRHSPEAWTAARCGHAYTSRPHSAGEGQRAADPLPYHRQRTGQGHPTV